MSTQQQYELDSDPLMQLFLAVTEPEQTCLWVSEGGQVCGETLPADPKDVSTHFRNAHGLRGDTKETITCAWHNCDAHPLQLRNMVRHILSVHLELLKWTCPNCLKTLSRRGTGHQCLPPGGNTDGNV